MESKRKHFRFPVYDDEQGVKRSTPKPSSAQQESDYQPAFSGRRPFLEKHVVPVAEEKDFSSQPIQMDPVQSYDEPDIQMESISKINEQATAKAHRTLLEDKRDNEPEEMAVTELSPMEHTEEPINEDEKHHVTDEDVHHDSPRSKMSEEYRRFANDGSNNQDVIEEELEEDERLPNIKEDIRQSREQREDDIPFRRKQRHKHQN